MIPEKLSIAAYNRYLTYWGKAEVQSERVIGISSSLVNLNYTPRGIEVFMPDERLYYVVVTDLRMIFVPNHDLVSYYRSHPVIREADSSQGNTGLGGMLRRMIRDKLAINDEGHVKYLSNFANMVYFQDTVSDDSDLWIHINRKKSVFFENVTEPTIVLHTESAGDVKELLELLKKSHLSGYRYIGEDKKLYDHTGKVDPLC